MKQLFTLLLFTLSFLLTSAKTFAIEICESFDKVSFEKTCLEQKIDFVYLLNEGFVWVETENLPNFSFVCYLTEVNFWEQQFVFSKPEVLVKTLGSDSKSLQNLPSNFQVSKHPFIPNVFRVKTPFLRDQDLQEFVLELQKKNDIQIASVNQVFNLQVCSNDPLFDRQWSIENNGTALQSNGTVDADMQVSDAWNIQPSSSSIKIAILDSGVDTLHEDLRNNILAGFDGFATDTTDTRGYPTLNYSNDGHGTACAGIAAAEINNNLGIAGIAPFCKIIPIRIFYYQIFGGAGVQPTTNTDALLSGSAYAWRIANADVMSTSAGLNSLAIGLLGIQTQIINEEINEAFNSGRNGFGVPMFFSAGNDDFEDVLWPADLENTIAVGASSMCDERKNPNDCSPEDWGSSYGLTLDIIAPGVRIASTDVTGGAGFSSGAYTNTFNGTSAACPNAAGVGALILSENPGLHARDVKAILNISAERVAGYVYDSTTIHGTWNNEVGHGRVDAYEAVLLAQTYESTVGISNILNQNFNINFYPNPTKGFLYIENNENRSFSLQAFNVLGSLILEFNLNEFESKTISLPEGCYFLKSYDGIVLQKVIVY
jgi:subtilisin family serine protease